MHIILLPGNNKGSKDWIEEVESELLDYFDSSHVHYYKHWQGSDTDEINFSLELKRLSKIVDDYGEYTLLAKSAGTLLSLLGIKQGVLSPKRCIFIGTAVEWGRRKGIDIEWLIENHSVPTLFIHQTHDPVISYKALENLLCTSLVHNYQVVEVQGDDHHYKEILSLKMTVKEYLMHIEHA
jgi:pimeloyl-ACP methyl ester carboxylesterase